MFGEFLKINPRHSRLLCHDIPPGKGTIILSDVSILHGGHRARCAGGRHFLEPPERCTPGGFGACWGSVPLEGGAEQDAAKHEIY